MRVLHVVASNRWTGAAAPAFGEVEALRRAGVHADYAYVAGYKLQQKLSEVSFAHPLLVKRENPVAIVRSLHALTRFVDREDIDIIHAHLTYDHALANVVSWRRPVRVVRTIHSHRAMRRLLVSRAAAVCVVNSDLRVGREAVFTPPPVDHRIFTPNGPSIRERLEIPAGAPLVGSIGKIAPRRGFEDVLRTFAVMSASRPEARLMIIGHGPHRAALERLSRSLGIDHRVIWAGYHEQDLADYLRGLDLLLFTRTGSDEGHRAVTETLACGVPVASYPVPGIRLLLGSLADEAVAATAEPTPLARVALGLLERSQSLRGRCVDATAINAYEVTAQRLTRVYEVVVSRRAR
jgi:1,2-diacylglycerol 3-alpha-glucosyltransferase